MVGDADEVRPSHPYRDVRRTRPRGTQCSTRERRSRRPRGRALRGALDN